MGVCLGGLYKCTLTQLLAGVERGPERRTEPRGAGRKPRAGHCGRESSLGLVMHPFLGYRRACAPRLARVVGSAGSKHAGPDRGSLRLLEGEAKCPSQGVASVGRIGYFSVPIQAPEPWCEHSGPRAGEPPGGQWGAADLSSQGGPPEGLELVCELRCHRACVTELLGSHRSGGENHRASLQGSGDAPCVHDCVSV